MFTPVSESEVSVISPVPFGVRVRLASVNVPIVASLPPPRLSRVESIPRVAAASIVARLPALIVVSAAAVRVVVPLRTVVVLVRVVVSPRVILVAPALSSMSLPPT